MTMPGDNDRPLTGGTRAGGSPVTSTSVSGSRLTSTTSGHDVTGRMTGLSTEQHVTTVRPSGRDAHLGPFKTSAAATFALVFGLAALFCALTAILSPAAVLFGVIGVVLGIVGLAMAKRPHVTGKGVAIGGLVTSLLGLLLGGAVLAGAGVLVNDERRLDQLQNRVDDLRADLPSTGELREELPN
jgi:membrane-bound ClpP family serine protease